MYFVLLSETNLTINLNHLVLVQWDFVDELITDSTFTTAIAMTDGNKFFITKNDAHVLWKALERFNYKVEQFIQPSEATPKNITKPHIPIAKP